MQCGGTSFGVFHHAAKGLFGVDLGSFSDKHFGQVGVHSEVVAVANQHDLAGPGNTHDRSDFALKHGAGCGLRGGSDVDTWVLDGDARGSRNRILSKCLRDHAPLDGPRKLSAVGRKIFGEGRSFRRQRVSAAHVLGARPASGRLALLAKFFLDDGRNLLLEFGQLLLLFLDSGRDLTLFLFERVQCLGLLGAFFGEQLLLTQLLTQQLLLTVALDFHGCDSLGLRLLVRTNFFDLLFAELGVLPQVVHPLNGH